MTKKEKQTDFKELHKRWMGCLGGKDSHSINQQITRLIWDDAIFRIINKAIEIAPKDSRGVTKLNGEVYQFIKRSFFQSQMLGIRRLIDGKGLEGSKGVFSLTSLLDDMENNTSFITRKNLFDVVELEYDIDKAHAERKKWIDELKFESNEGLEHRFCADFIEERHKSIDDLCGKKRDKRSPDDSPSLGFFLNIKEKLEKEGEKIKVRVDKFIAHSATPVSRLDKNADEVRITWMDLSKIQKMICKIIHYLLLMLDFSNRNFFPLEQFNFLRYIDEPLVSTEKIEILRDVFEEHRADVNNWNSYDCKIVDGKILFDL